MRSTSFAEGKIGDLVVLEGGFTPERDLADLDARLPWSSSSASG
jgi:hypothetical protein